MPYTRSQKVSSDDKMEQSSGESSFIGEEEEEESSSSNSSPQKYARYGTKSPVNKLYPNLPRDPQLSPNFRYQRKFGESSPASSLSDLSPDLRYRTRVGASIPTTPQSDVSYTSKDTPDSQNMQYESTEYAENKTPMKAHYTATILNRNPTKNSDIPKNNNFNYIYVIIMLVASLIASGAGYYVLSTPQSLKGAKPELHADVLKYFETGFNKIENGFKQQNSDTLISLKAAIKSVLRKKEPKEPACIMLIGEKESEETTNCFAETLVKLTSEAFSKLTSQHEETTPKITRLDIKGENITHFLEKRASAVAGGRSHVMLILGLENFPSDTVGFLHTYCDNEYAPVKRLVLFITVNLPRKLIRDSDIADLQNIDIYRMWKNSVKEDKLGALENRIGNNRVFVSVETGETLYRFCPKR